MKPPDLRAYFEAMYDGAGDPYGVRARWYEQRKRAIGLASLPRARFRHCYEPGCGNGELTVALAERCDAVLASDFSANALHSARARTAPLAHVRLAQHRLPGDWPVGERFDLVVLSELGYFLALPDVQALAQRCVAGLDDDGVLLACDWLPDFADRATPTEAVHAALAATGLALLVLHAEGDFVLRVWARDARSVAQREGIR